MRLAAVALAACASRVPVLSVHDTEHCVDASVPAELVAPHGIEVGVCFGALDCFVVDHVRGAILDRIDRGHPEQGDPSELTVRRPPDLFEIERTETDTTICNRDHSVCHTLRLPNVADQQTVLPALSATGQELYFVARDGNRAAYLDTIAVDARARRTGRVPLPIAPPIDDHGFTVDRVGTAILVRDSITLGLDNERSQHILVDPLTATVRTLGNGTALALDEETALVLEGTRASIIKTRGLVTLTSRPTGDGMAAGANGNIAVLAHANPPTIIVIENRRFTRSWRLPTCKP